MRRTWITLLAAALVLLLATPATAGKPSCNPEDPNYTPDHPTCASEDPGDDPVLVDVAMTGALATTCDDGDGIAGTMVMQREADGLSPTAPTELAIFELDIQGVDTSRQYPQPVVASGFSGCHGEQLDGNDSPYGGLFITLDDSGAVTDVLWHFDYYLETMTRGKREVMALMEHFTLSGHDLTWDAGTSIASGWFNVLYHLEDVANHVSVGYEPVDGSPVYLVFTLTMEPHSG
jgi:hypothetical protein